MWCREVLWRFEDGEGWQFRLQTTRRHVSEGRTSNSYPAIRRNSLLFFRCTHKDLLIECYVMISCYLRSYLLYKIELQVPNSLICVDYMVQLWLPLRFKATVKLPAILLTIIRSEIVLERDRRSRLPCGLRHEPAAAKLLGSRFRIRLCA
jgi:hypothetical protein